MAIEHWALFGAMVLGLVHLTAASFMFKAQVGNAYSVGPRDEDLRPTGVAGRLDRAQRNFLETFAIFASAVLLLGTLGRTGGWLSEAGAVSTWAAGCCFCRSTRPGRHGCGHSAGTSPPQGWPW